MRNFLLASALNWLREFHVDGLRVDAVASMLYLDYSREPGEWLPNAHGGREDLEPIDVPAGAQRGRARARSPASVAVAEESTAWPGVTRGRPATAASGSASSGTWAGCTTRSEYFSREPVHRRFHHDELTFSMVYAFSENFVLPLSHDEVVHGKRSLLGKMPGDRWQQLANLRALYAYMWAHPGKKLLFMGGELAQEREWNHDRSLDWELLERPEHAGVARLVRDLNRAVPRRAGAVGGRLRPARRSAGSRRTTPTTTSFAFARRRPGRRSHRSPASCNLSPVPRHDYRVGLPRGGTAGVEIAQHRLAVLRRLGRGQRRRGRGRAA